MLFIFFSELFLLPTFYHQSIQNTNSASLAGIK
jgi:hypothetical protein